MAPRSFRNVRQRLLPSCRCSAMDVRGRAAVDVAAVDHAAMMKAHLPLSERDDSLERPVLIADEPSLECLQILRIGIFWDVHVIW